MAAPADYRGRFAPSPTGRLHLGHARTFLVAWLRARQAGGEIVMRMEDLDGPRVVHGADAAILEDLRWLGLDWDGPPVYQSARHPAYRRALERLEAGGHLFRCSCTRKEVAASAPHGEGDLGPRYPGTCRGGPTRPERACSLRMRMPDPPPAFCDGLHGEMRVAAAAGDFVVRRADGLFAYQLAVVVDDGDMGITEVVRGDDLLSSTPRQLAVYEALGIRPPAFLHVPLVLGQDGARLSKRHGSVALGDYRSSGRSPEAVIGLLASTLGMGSEPRTAADLLHGFSPDCLPREPVVFDNPD